MVNSEGWALVFGWRVPIAVLGCERETRTGTGLQLGRQSLVQHLLRRERALTFFIEQAQKSLRSLEMERRDAHIYKRTHNNLLGPPGLGFEQLQIKIFWKSGLASLEIGPAELRLKYSENF